jgi:hypothetical protein
MAAMNDISFSWRAYLKMKRLDGIVYGHVKEKSRITMIVLFFSFFSSFFLNYFWTSQVKEF